VTPNATFVTIIQYIFQNCKEKVTNFNIFFDKIRPQKEKVHIAQKSNAHFGYFAVI